jgi:hypothetical protein
LHSEISFSSGEIYGAGPWFATEFKCVFRRRRTGEWVDARGAIFCETNGQLVTEMRMYWHRRLDKDPAQTWLRKKIASAMNFDAAYPPPSLAAVDEMPWDS